MAAHFLVNVRQGARPWVSTGESLTGASEECGVGQHGTDHP